MAGLVVGPGFSPTSPRPGDGSVVVKSGDTLAGIARREGVTLDALLKENPAVTDPDVIRVGQTLQLPTAPASTPPVWNPIDIFEPARPTEWRPPLVKPEAQVAPTAPPAPEKGWLGGLVDGVRKLWRTFFPAPRSDAESAPLSLGANERYRDALVLASERTSIDPAAIASVIGAEAARVKGSTLTEMTDETFYARHPELNGRPLTSADTELVAEWKQVLKETRDVWDPSSYNSSSGATGLTQFLSGTWLGEARRSGTYLNEVAREKGFVDAGNKVVDGKKDDLLALRKDATLSIVAAAEYGKANLDGLAKKGHVAEDATDDDKARLMYLAHHEGLGGANTFLKGTLTDARAKVLLSYNVSSGPRAALVKKHGSESAAYIAWLNGYIDTHIKPENYR